MKSLKFTLLCLFAFSIPFLFTTCDTEDLTTIEVPLNNLDFEIPFFAEKSTFKSDTEDAFYSFYGKSDKINIANDMFADLEKYNIANLQFIIKDITIEIKKTDGNSGTSIKDFKSTTINVAENVIASYEKLGITDLGKPFSEDKLINYFAAIFNKIQSGETVILDVNGLTDIIPAGVNEVELGVIAIKPTISAKINLKK